MVHSSSSCHSAAGTVPATAPARERTMASQIDGRRSTFHHAKIADSISLRSGMRAAGDLATCRAKLIQQPRHVSGRCADELKTSMDEMRKWPRGYQFCSVRYAAVAG